MSSRSVRHRKMTQSLIEHLGRRDRFELLEARAKVRAVPFQGGIHRVLQAVRQIIDAEMIETFCVQIRGDQVGVNSFARQDGFAAGL